MKKTNKQVLIILGFVAVAIVFFFIGRYTANTTTNSATAQSNKKIHSQKDVKKINKSSDNDDFKITLDSVTTEKAQIGDGHRLMSTDSFNVKTLLSKKYYITTVETTIENKTNEDINTSSTDGQYAIIDGDGNARTAEGQTLLSYTDMEPSYPETFPKKSKTKIQFIILSNKNNFNSKDIKIQIPTFYKGNTTDSGSYVGGTFSFEN